MSVQVLKEIVFVAMGDETFRHKLVFQPDETLPKYDLTQQELIALRLGDYERLVKLGLEPGLAQYASSMFSKRR